MSIYSLNKYKLCHSTFNFTNKIKMANYFLSKLLFGFFIYTITSATESTDYNLTMTRASRPKQLGDCALKQCKADKDCQSCKILNCGQSLCKAYKGFCTTDGFCDYCAKFLKPCNFGTKSDPFLNGRLQCCDLIGKGGDWKEKKQATIGCHDAFGGRWTCNHQCMIPNDFQATGHAKFQHCEDKDGYSFYYNHYSNCSGTKPNTAFVCPRFDDEARAIECGITYADCSGDIKCCNGYKCEEGTCKRDCIDTGKSCKNAMDCCVKATSVKAAKCDITKSDSTFKCYQK